MHRGPLDIVTHQGEIIINHTERQGSNSSLCWAYPQMLPGSNGEQKDSVIDLAINGDPEFMHTMHGGHCLVGYLCPA